MNQARALDLLVPGDPAQRTGGSLYDARITAGLRDAGWTVRVHGLRGRFPQPSETSRRELHAALESVPDDSLAVVDGLALGGLPEVAENHSQRISLVALIHHPLCDETGLPDSIAQQLLQTESRAAQACRRIITTSHFTARRLEALGIGRQRARVVEPGTDPAPLACVARTPEPVDQTPQLLYIGSLVPRKAQDVLINALAMLTDHDWRCSLVGAPRDPEFATHVHALIDKHGLRGRIELPGEADEDALQAAYDQADLFVLPSCYEGFGMVATEALARGLPLVSTTGGALADTVPDMAALKVQPGDPAALADALARWFGDPELRLRLLAGAKKARSNLADWPTAAARFAEALQES